MTNLLKNALFLVAMLVAKTAFGQSHAAGLEAMMLEDWDKAIRVFSGLTQVNPADQSAFLSLGNAYLAKGDKENALMNFKKSFDAKTDAPMAFVANGRILLVQDNNLAEAEKQFNKAKKYAKKDMTTWRQIGESYFFYVAPGASKPDLAKAKQYLTEALDVSTKDFALQMTLGTCNKEMSEGGPAAQHYEFAEQLEPQNPLPKLMLAKVYRIGKVPEKPLTYYNKAIAIAPTFTPALRGKAEYLFFVLGKYDEAQKAYKDLIDRGTEVTIEDEMQLANCYYLTKDCVNCSDLVEKILKKDPTKNYLRRLQAYCDYENGQYVRGLKTLDEYFKIVPADKILPSDYDYHAKLILQTKGDTTLAINDYLKEIEMDKSRWKLYEDIDKLEWSRKNYCAALQAYKMYLDSVETPRATEWYNLGMRYYFCKDEPMRYENAEKAFAKVTEINPAAAIGWLWAAKSAAFQDPSPDSIAVHPELANEYGKARIYYEKFAEVAEFEIDKNKKDLLKGYQYLAYCYFVNKDAAKFNLAMDKWQTLETIVDQLQIITDMRGAFEKETGVPSKFNVFTFPKKTVSNGIAAPSNNKEKLIKMERANSGTFNIPCKINGLQLIFIFDTGASNVSISLTEALFMMKNGYLKNEDILGRENYKIANGEIVSGMSIMIKEIDIDGLILRDVKASVSDSIEAPLLLGQSALEKLGKIEIDYKTNTLKISN